MTKKKKATIISLSVVGGVLLTAGVLALIIFVGFWFLWPTPQWMRQSIYDDCADDANYSTKCGTAELYVSEKYDYAYIKIDTGEEFLYTYEIDSVNNDYLKSNGFYDSLTDFEINDMGLKVYPLEGTVTLIINASIWWDGDEPNLVSIDVDGTTYLDYETGKANLLYYIQNVMY